MKVFSLYIRMVSVLLLMAVPAVADGEPEKWPGVDVVVIENLAKAAGRSVQGPLINTDQGDLLLFLFLLAGALGGFVAGYAYRTLAKFPPDGEKS